MRTPGAAAGRVVGCAALAARRAILPHARLGDVLVVVRPPRRLMRQLHGGGRDVHDVELIGQRLHHHAERVDVALEDVLAKGRGGHVEPARAHVGHRGQRLLRHTAPRDALDVPEHAVLARLGQRDGHALTPGTPHASDAVHVLRGGGRHVEVDHVRELVDIEAACRHIGGDEQVGGARPQATHHAVALLLGHAAVQGLGLVTAAVEGLDQLLNLDARAAEHDCRSGLLGVEQAHKRRGLVGPLHHVGLLAHLRGLALGGWLGVDLHAHGVGEVALRDGSDARRHGGREQHGLAGLRNGIEDRPDVLGESHVEHLVRLVQHHRRDVVELQGAARHVVACAARGCHHHVHPALERLHLAEDGLAAVHRQHARAQPPAVLVHGLRHLHGQLAGGHQHQRPGAPPRADAVHRVQQGQRERGRLSGTGGRVAQKVAPLDEVRDGLELDGRGLLIAELREGGEDLIAQPQAAEGRLIDAADSA